MDDVEQQNPAGPFEIDRRTVLKVLGGAGLVAVAGSRLVTHGAARTVLGLANARRASSTPTTQVFVHRRDDLFNLRFDLYNMVVTTTPRPQIVPDGSGNTPFIIVVFPLQHVGEEAVVLSGGPPSWPTPPLQSRASGPSQLAFQVPPGLLPIPFTLTGLLTWTRFLPLLVPVAFTPNTAMPQVPTSQQSAIEAPWALFLSPDQNGGWNHSANPVTHGSWTELWQTRLGVGNVEPPAAKPLIRAVWTPGWPFGVADPPFPMSLKGQDRADLVTLTSGGHSVTGGPIAGVPIPVDLLMLTPLGTSLQVHGFWSAGRGTSLTDWRHHMATGRDSYVRVVNAGYLYPFGQRASKITITDREFQVDQAGDVVAYLVQTTFIVVNQPTRAFDGSSPEPFSGRQNPMRQVTATTLVTPTLQVDSTVHVPGTSPGLAIWVRSNGVDVPFAFKSVDIEGRAADFSTSAIWIDETLGNDQTTINAVSTEYSSSSNVAARRPGLHGQLLAFADTVGAKPGSTAHHVETLELGGPYVAGVAAFTPSFYPVVASADIRLPAAEQVAGSQSTPASPPTVVFPGQYLLNGFQSGIPEVFLQVANNVPGLQIPPNLAGGMATPNFNIDGIARDLGPVADSAGLLGGTFTPATFFAGLGAKILGAISLADIITTVTGAAISGGGKAPKIVSAPVYPGNDTSKAPQALMTTLDWTPTVKGDPAGFFVPSGDVNQTLAIHVKIYAPITDTSKTTYDIDGQLVNFDLVLFGNAATFIRVHFDKVHFSAKTGSKANVDVNVSNVTFEGPLQFIQDFEQFFASLGGPSIDLEPTGVNASYSLHLPDVGIGVFSLQNISLNGALNIPFDGSPVRLQVSFCTRDNPFILSISLFAGGGFFGIRLGADGIEMIEVSLEFGASLSIDLGVASGGVSIMAGIYFSLTTTPTNQVTLTGFLQASGNLEVLGIISISIVFYLGFSYLSTGKVYGKASVTVTVKVLFFSASVDLTVEKRLGGSGDPTFVQAISQRDWNTYCAAFA